MPEVGTKIPALDGLRGIAIILVMLYHFMLYGTKPVSHFIDVSAKGILGSGWIGVDLFFVLSGFLITGILIDTKNEDSYFRTFYARRFLRIFPLYYGFLIVFLLFAPFLLPVSSSFDTLLSEQAWYWTYLVNIRIGLMGWPPDYVLGHFWSLAVEEQFYLFWPLVIFFSRKRALPWVCCSLLLIGLTFRCAVILMHFKTGAYVLTPARVDALAVGGLLAVALRSPEGKAYLSRFTMPVLWSSGFVLTVLALAHRHWDPRLDPDATAVLTIGLTALALFFGAVLILAITSSPAQGLGKLCNSRVLRFFGQYSYALYVFHHPVAIYLGEATMATEWFPNPFIPGILLFTVIATILSVMLALLSWHVLELPFLRLKRYFTYIPTPQGTYT